MKTINLGEKLQTLRKEMKMSQKEFTLLLNIPQPSLSAYENDRNSSTMEVLINIAQKCKVSLDWLCGISSSKHNISSLTDISDILYALMELNEIGFKIDIHDQLVNDLETEDDKWYTSLIVYEDDPNYPFNADLYNLIRKIVNDYSNLESYAVSKEMCELV